MALNRLSIDIELKDLLDLHKKDVLLSLNCHGIALVNSFDSSKMVVTATMQYSKTFYKTDSQGKYVPYQREYPVLVDCPVIVLGGGASGLSFPIAAGDECLILFNDRDIDNWFSGATSGPVASNRLHSFSDGMALIWNVDNPGYDSARAVLYNGTTGVGVSSDKVKIYNAGTTLNTLLQNLCTQLQALTVTCAAPGSPSTVPVNAAAIAAIATQLGALLE